MFKTNTRVLILYFILCYSFICSYGYGVGMNTGRNDLIDALGFSYD